MDTAAPPGIARPDAPPTIAITLEGQTLARGGGWHAFWPHGQLIEKGP